MKAKLALTFCHMSLISRPLTGYRSVPCSRPTTTCVPAEEWQRFRISLWNTVTTGYKWRRFPTGTPFSKISKRYSCLFIFPSDQIHLIFCRLPDVYHATLSPGNGGRVRSVHATAASRLAFEEPAAPLVTPMVCRLCACFPLDMETFFYFFCSTLNSGDLCPCVPMTLQEQKQMGRQALLSDAGSSEATMNFSSCKLSALDSWALADMGGLRWNIHDASMATSAISIFCDPFLLTCIVENLKNSLYSNWTLVVRLLQRCSVNTLLCKTLHMLFKSFGGASIIRGVSLMASFK